MRRPGALQGALLLSPALLLFGYFYIYPLARLVGTSFLGDAGDGGLTLTAENYQKFFVSPFYLSVMGQTLKISAIVTVLTILLGYPVAYLLSNLRQAAVNRLLILILLPFWTSLLVRTYAWTVLLQNRGVINSTLMEAGVIERPLPLIFNEQSVVIGTTHIMLPFMILPIYAVLKGLDPAFRRAALGLGATPLRTFWHVTLPLSLPGMAAGALIVFIMYPRPSPPRRGGEGEKGGAACVPPPPLVGGGERAVGSSHRRPEAAAARAAGSRFVSRISPCPA